LRYEDLILNPNKIINQICHFLDIPYEEIMLNSYGKPSSLDGKIRKGIDPTRASAWEKKINRWEKMLIDIFTYHSKKKFNNMG